MRVCVCARVEFSAFPRGYITPRSSFEKKKRPPGVLKFSPRGRAFARLKTLPRGENKAIHGMFSKSRLLSFPCRKQRIKKTLGIFSQKGTHRAASSRPDIYQLLFFPCFTKPGIPKPQIHVEPPKYPRELRIMHELGAIGSCSVPCATCSVVS